jgi:hypothetical protein
MADGKFLNLRISKYWIWLWIIAFIITISSAFYQRMTGPNYPMRGKESISEQDVSFKLLRSGIVEKDAPIILEVSNTAISGHVQYRRYKSHDEWSTMLLQRKGNRLEAFLPHQPAAGKLMYFVYLKKDDQEVSLTGKEPVILRYRGSVPAYIMIPHIFLMFAAMMFSNRAGLEALDAQGRTFKYMIWTIVLFFIGGFIFGPLMQKFAFGNYWTGFPFGYDLTDNKTVIAMVGWIIAWIANSRDKSRRVWIIFAAVLMLAIYLIPHSVLGSEIDYTKLPQ